MGSANGRDGLGMEIRPRFRGRGPGEAPVPPCPACRTRTPGRGRSPCRGRMVSGTPARGSGIADCRMPIADCGKRSRASPGFNRAAARTVSHSQFLSTSPSSFGNRQLGQSAIVLALSSSSNTSRRPMRRPASASSSGRMGRRRPWTGWCRGRSPRGRGCSRRRGRRARARSAPLRSTDGGGLHRRRRGAETQDAVQPLDGLLRRELLPALAGELLERLPQQRVLGRHLLERRVEPQLHGGEFRVHLGEGMPPVMIQPAEPRERASPLPTSSSTPPPPCVRSSELLSELRSQECHGHRRHP